MEFVTTNAHPYHKVIAHFGTYRFEYFHAEAHAIFETTAPLVGTLVDPRAPELIDQVLVHGGQFDTVEPALFGPSRGLGEVTDNPPNLFHLNRLAGGAVYRFANARGGYQRRPIEAIPA